ncbi:MAG: PIN domain-containing protein [Acidobacteria bacterium]|nr:PIN domain-containing protein [Acidobacteriota bacterium]
MVPIQDPPVIVFLDTSALSAVFLAAHEHHEPSFALFEGLTRAQARCAAHSPEEVFETLTSLPVEPRIPVAAAEEMLDAIRERVEPVALSPAEYPAALSAAASRPGAALHDVLIAACARKARADIFYTWNVELFQRLLPELGDAVRRP